MTPATVSPWGSLFDNCTVSSCLEIKAAGDDVHPPVALSPLDQTAIVTFVSVSGVLLYPQQLDAEKLTKASKLLAAKYPIIAGR